MTTPTIVTIEDATQTLLGAAKEARTILDRAFNEGALDDETIWGLYPDPYGMLKDLKTSIDIFEAVNTRPSSPIADRLADALKEAIKETRELFKELPEPPCFQDWERVHAAEQILTEYDAQRASNEPTTASNDGWVSVEERLPEEGALVLASGWPGKNPRFKRWMNTAIFKNGQFIDGDDDDPEAEDDLLSFLDVTHWMPVQLPQPPKGVTT